jgi:hypothetical protein
MGREMIRRIGCSRIRVHFADCRTVNLDFATRSFGEKASLVLQQVRILDRQFAELCQTREHLLTRLVNGDPAI